MTLEGGEGRVLESLWKLGRATAAEIAVKAQLDRGSVLNMMSRLEKDGLVRRAKITRKRGPPRPTRTHRRQAIRFMAAPYRSRETDHGVTAPMALATMERPISRNGEAVQGRGRPEIVWEAAAPPEVVQEVFDTVSRNL